MESWGPPSGGFRVDEAKGQREREREGERDGARGKMRGR